MAIRKKSGDNFPLDCKGEMIFLGSIVCISMVDIPPTGEPEAKLVLGYVSKMTQKNGIDITIMPPIESLTQTVTKTGDVKEVKKTIYPKHVVRIKKVSEQVNVIDRETLKVRDDYHEALRMEAGKI